MQSGIVKPSIVIWVPTEYLKSGSRGVGGVVGKCMALWPHTPKSAAPV